ncbi:MAG: rRNA maturation RNase YbeY [Bacteroidales bacterium]|nr:rRNA maturation RNase YbeY [Bacteroidales bacterium]
MISFFKENTTFDIKQKNKIKSWLKNVASGYGFSAGDLNYVFCDDEYLLQMNRQYLGHDYYTDIITFDSREDACSKRLDGDIFISVDTVRANGEEYGEGFEREIMRVIAHGLLHLMGFDDHTASQQKKMREAENTALAQWDTIMMS